MASSFLKVVHFIIVILWFLRITKFPSAFVNYRLWLTTIGEMLKGGAG